MNLRDRDNLRAKDKRPVPKVSFVRRLDCITFYFAIQHYEHAYVLVWEWLAASLNLVVPTREGTQSLWFGAHVLVCSFMSTVSR